MTNEVDRKIITDIGEDYFKELAFSNLDFPAALCELIDNGITASLKKTRCTVNIDIQLRSVGESQLEIMIADDGAGISREDIVNGVFRPAGRTRETVECYKGLREHGMGLKQALAWLTKETNYDFELRTSFLSRDDSSPEYTKVEGPLAKEMSWSPSTISEWNEWIGPRGHNKRTGTRLRFRTTMEQCKSGWREKFGLEPQKLILMKDLVDILNEQLGVTYRYFLKPKKRTKFCNTIHLKYWETGKTMSKSLPVKPKDIPFLRNPRKNRFIIKEGTNTLNVVYVRGISDPKQVATNKVFYRHDMRAQGLDVVLHGKVMESAYYPWPTQRHPEQNGLVGEIFLRSEDVPTILTKNRLLWTSPLLAKLRQKIIETDFGSKKTMRPSYRDLEERSKPRSVSPPKPTRGYTPTIWWSETDMKRHFVDLLRRAANDEGYTEARVEQEPKAWDLAKTGTLELPGDIIYEE